ncbi:MAG: hypothetical protein A3F90_18955 [Deltaproteobacteria bacterium RIFCSPLOWO2_12_FULL_60_19]|nr:MAG: hypothetical protein A3F90_18955 [Deltaproteobacteria bacterium RIFCSPLOWO2_12_FULL_60_19]
MSDKISQEEFVLRAIETLREPGRKGIHSVYSRFNEAFRGYFHEDPVEATRGLAAKRVIEKRPTRGGVILYLPGEAPESSGSGALEKIVGKLPSGGTDGGESKESANGRGGRTVPGGPSEWVILVALPVYFHNKKPAAEPRGSVPEHCRGTAQGGYLI